MKKALVTDIEYPVTLSILVYISGFMLCSGIWCLATGTGSKYTGVVLLVFGLVALFAYVIYLVYFYYTQCKEVAATAAVPMDPNYTDQELQ
jgi:hypothetical protein